MTVAAAEAAGHWEYAGKTYYFCSTYCLDLFKTNPQRFLAAAAGPAPSAPASPPVAVPPGAIWTCPMHPEIVRDGPGSCPICGMALEPMAITADEAENPELRDMTPAVLGCSAALTAPLLVLAMGGDVAAAAARPACGPPRPGSSSRWRRRWCSGAAGRSSCARSASVRHRSLNMFTLIGARRRGRRIVYSVVAIAAPGLFPRVVPRAWRHGRRLLRGRRGDRHAGPARPGAGAARAQPDRRGHPALLGLAPQDGAAAARRRAAKEDVPLDARAGRRPAAGAAGREGAGRRRRRSRGRARSTSR